MGPLKVIDSFSFSEVHDNITLNKLPVGPFSPHAHHQIDRSSITTKWTKIASAIAAGTSFVLKKEITPGVSTIPYMLLIKHLCLKECLI